MYLVWKNEEYFGNKQIKTDFVVLKIEKNIAIYVPLYYHICTYLYPCFHYTVLLDECLLSCQRLDEFIQNPFLGKHD